MKHVLLAAAVAVSGAQAAGAASLPTAFTSVAIFGDSYSDPGNASGAIKALTGLTYPQPEYYEDPATGLRQFSNGRVWAAQMTDLFALAGRDAANYAFGAARAIEGQTIPPLPFPQVDILPDLPTQIGQFLTEVATAAFTPGPSPLGIVFIGGNDLTAAASDNAGDPAGLRADAEAAAMAVGAGAAALAASGIDTIALLNIGDVGAIPRFNLFAPGLAAAATDATGFFNDQLALEAQALRAAGTRVIEVDLAARLGQILDDPSLVGLSDAVTPCGVPVAVNGLDLPIYNFLFCTPSPANTDSVFFDDIHVSKEVQDEIFRLTRATIAAAVVPLPAPALLLLGGLAALGGVRLRRAA